MARASSPAIGGSSDLRRGIAVAPAQSGARVQQGDLRARPHLAPPRSERGSAPNVARCPSQNP